MVFNNISAILWRPVVLVEESLTKLFITYEWDMSSQL